MSAPETFVLVVGDAMLDVWHRGQGHKRSPEAPVPIFQPETMMETPGGAAHVAALCSKLGARTLFPLVTGNDKTGTRLERLCSRADIKGLVPARAILDRTTVKRRFIDTDGNHLMRVDVDGQRVEGVEDLLMQLRTLVHISDAIILSDYRKGVFTEELAQAVIGWANEEGVPTFVDSKRPHDAMWRGAFCFKHNVQEHGPYAGLGFVKSQQARGLVVTYGGFGLRVWQDEPEGVAVAAEIDPHADVCGAGDAVVAALAVAYARGMPLLGAASSANAYAGAHVATPTANRPAPPPDHLPDPASLLEQPRESIDVLGFANGCFDLLHEGHRQLLTQAQAQCTHLVVALNSDLSVRRLKGAGRPIEPFAERKRKVLEVVPDAIITEFYHTPRALIDWLKPDVIFKGAQYVPENVIGHDVAEVVLIDMVPGISTTKKIEEGKAA